MSGGRRGGGVDSFSYRQERAEHYFRARVGSFESSSEALSIDTNFVEFKEMRATRWTAQGGVSVEAKTVSTLSNRNCRHAFDAASAPRALPPSRVCSQFDGNGSFRGVRGPRQCTATGPRLFPAVVPVSLPQQLGSPGTRPLFHFSRSFLYIKVRVGLYKSLLVQLSAYRQYIGALSYRETFGHPRSEYYSHVGR